MQNLPTGATPANINFAFFLLVSQFFKAVFANSSLKSENLKKYLPG
jgi:hypothetical protein